jgi:hypothetical protein
MTFLRRLLWLFPIALFFLNPAFACTSDDNYQYGAAEMRAAVEGEWTFTITPTGGAPLQAHVRLTQSAHAPATAAQARPSGLVRPAYACGTRTLVASASACIDSTEMPLDVMFLDGDPSLSSASLSGAFSVHGLTFVQGDLYLVMGPYQLLLQVSADGSTGSPQLYPASTSGTLAVTRP